MFDRQLWETQKDELLTQVVERLQLLPASVHTWIGVSHCACIDILETAFAIPDGNEVQSNLIRTYGVEFTKRVQRPSKTDLTSLCYHLFCGHASLNILSTFDISVVHGLYTAAATIYDMPMSTHAKWVSFSNGQRTKNENPDQIVQNIGLAVLFGIMFGFGVLTTESKVNPEWLESNATWFGKLVLMSAQTVKERLPQTGN